MEHHHQVPEFREIQEMDSGEKRLNELGYKQELRRQMTLFKTLAISFSTMTLFTGITPLYGSSLMYAGPATLVWGWTTGSLYFWAAHLAGPKWGPFASWCCAWLETIGLVAGIGTQVIGGLVIVILLPLVATTTQSASYVFTHFEVGSGTTGVSSMPYAVILSFLVSQYSLYGYDTAAHLTEETKGADKNGPIAILSSIGIITVFGWAYILALTFSIQDFSYLYDPSNETAGAFVPAQILYDAFHGRYQNSAGAIILLFVIWGSFFFGGLSITTSAARVVYALSRDKGLPFSSVWSKIHPKHKVPSNAVWLCAAICILLGLPILKVNVVFTAITSICTIGWVGGYAVPIFARMVMDEKKFKAGPFYLGKARRPVCFVAFIWICYTCCVFLLPTMYPITWDTFNYAPVALGIGLGLIMLWWVLDARKWFKGPVRNIDAPNGHKV
ncbi:Amino-acid permease BAT1 homolog [Linum perenne]